MSIYDYIDNFGMYSFDEKPFNEVDSAIFGFLSYADFSNIVGQGKILLKDVGRMHLGLHKGNEKNIVAVREATKLLKYMKDANRYKDCYLFRYIYEADHDVQFCALSIEYQRNHVYVSFEGTDQMISGWKENLLLSYSFPTLTHKKAIHYLNQFYTFGFKKLIVGGHSKGGNLALVGAMCCNSLVRSKIKEIYNFDGPGLLDKEFRSKKYKNVLPIYHHIIPNESIVGIMLYSSKDTVVHSNISGVLAHDIAFWDIDKDHFKRDKLSSFSRELRKGLLGFLDSHSESELKDIVSNLDEVCSRAKITSLIEFKEDYRKIITFIKACSYLDMESRNMLYDLLNVVIRALGDSKHKDFVDFVKKFRLDI